MTDHDQDGFEAFVKRAAEGYNAPDTATPREEMWTVIAERRAAARVALASRPVVAPDIAPAATRWRVRRYAPWIGMAATLALGVGIGSYVRRPRVEVAPPVASAESTLPPVATTDAATPNPEVPVAPTPANAGDAGPRRAAADRSAPAVRTAQAIDATNERETVDAPYSIASRQHLTRAEALIAVVAVAPEDALLDSLTGKWARDILTNTRLLLDSPAGDDPVRRRLLLDLESVLVQLVQKSGRVDEDKAMIDRSLQRTQLLTRLRTGAAGT